MRRLIFAFLLLLPIAYGQGNEANITIYVEGTIGIGISASPANCLDIGPCDTPPANFLTATVGQETGCLITIENKANVRDVVSLNTRIVDPSHEGWVRTAFSCVETVGECNGTEVTNMQIDPDVRNTSVFLSIKNFRVPPSDPYIELRGFSNTNFTVEDLGCIRIKVKQKGGVFRPFEAPVDSPLTYIFGILLASAIVLRKRKSLF